MSIKNKAAKGVAWSTIDVLGGQVITLIIFLILARLLSPAAFGLIAIASALIAVMEIFLKLGLNSAIIQREDLQPDHLDTAFWIYMAMGISLCGVMALGADSFAGLYDLPELGPVIRWLSILFVLHALQSVQEALFRRKLAFRPLAVRTLLARFLGGIAGVIMAFEGYGVWSLVGQQLVSGAVQMLILWFACDWKPSFKVSAKHFHDLFGFSISLMGSHGLAVMSKRMDDFLIGYFLGPTLLGYYTVAYRLVRLGTRLLAGTVQKVAFPVFSRMQGDNEQLQRAFYSAIRLTALIAFPGFCLLIALAPEIIPIMFGEKWLASVPIMQVLALMGILRAIMGFNVAIIVSQGKPFWKLTIQAAETFVMVGGFMLAVSWGILAVAIARVIAGFLIAPLWFAASQKLSKINTKQFFQSLSAPFYASLIMIVIILGVKELMTGALPVLAQFAMLALVAAGSYALVLKLVFPSVIKEVIGYIKSLKADNAAKKQRKAEKKAKQVS